MTRAPKILLLGAIVCCCLGAAQADEIYDQCKAAAAADAKRCGNEWMDREQGALNAAFAAVVAQTDGAIADSLAFEQTAWLQFWKASCAFMADTTFAPGGDAATYFACKARTIADRRAAIDTYARYIDN